MERFRITGQWLRVTGCLLALAMVLSGCVTARKAVRERVDQEVSGNQGVIYGDVPAPTRPEKTTREYIQVDVDLSEMFSRKPVEGKAAVAPVEEKKEEPAKPLAIWAEKVETRTYVVKPDQSLSTIAKEVYGDGSKWNVIYQANKDKIGDPNKIRAGMVLTIPDIGHKKAEK